LQHLLRSPFYTLLIRLNLRIIQKVIRLCGVQDALVQGGWYNAVAFFLPSITGNDVFPQRQQTGYYSTGYPSFTSGLDLIYFGSRIIALSALPDGTIIGTVF